MALAAALLEEHEPAEALRRWFGQLAAYARVKRGVIAAVEDSVWADLSSQTHSKLGGALTALLSAGAQQVAAGAHR